MRITFFTHYTELYGANMSMINLIDGLARYGHSAAVVCPDRGDLHDALASRRVETFVCPFAWWVSPRPSRFGSARRFLTNLRLLPQLIAQLEFWRTELVYSNSSVFCIGALAAARLGVAHVWHIREFGDRDYDLCSDVGKGVVRRSILSANATIFVSQALRRAFLGRKIPDTSHVIYNGVAAEAEFDARRQRADSLRDRRQPFTFALVGRFRESKGQAIAIQAFADLARQNPDVRLLLVGGAGHTGDQRYYNSCRRLISDLNLDKRVEMWGYVPDPERAFLAADVALMCSRHEAMGRVTAEAMSCCRPVIGFDSGGTSELIDDGRTGLLYRGGADALAAKMAAYSAAPDLARAHGVAAWSTARDRHSTERYAGQIEKRLRLLY
jgi:glycosyltransferase involved in cell wall biosynthesis